MRVSELSKRENVLSNIEKNSERLKKLQTDLSSGNSINRLSDDPIRSTMVQDIVSTVSRSEQMLNNIQDNVAWMERMELELQEASDLLVRARSLVVSESGSSSTAESRRVTARELGAVKEALFEVANARAGKVYLFSGTNTLTPSVQYNEPIQDAKIFTQDVVQKDIADLLDLTQFRAQFDGYSDKLYRVRISTTGPFGLAGFQVSDDDGMNWSEEEILLPTIDVHNPLGNDDEKITLKFADDQGLIGGLLPDFEGQFDVGEGGIIFPEGIEFVFLPNPHIGYKGNNQSKDVILGDGTTLPVQVTAEELFFKTSEDSVNIFDLMKSLEKSLMEDDGNAISARISDLDKALDQVLKKTSDIGNDLLRLQEARSKIENQVFSRQQRLSELRDVDLPEAMVHLNTAETENQVSLGVGGRLIQPSLLQFLR